MTIFKITVFSCVNTKKLKHTLIVKVKLNVLSCRVEYKTRSFKIKTTTLKIASPDHDARFNNYKPAIIMYHL